VGDECGGAAFFYVAGSMKSGAGWKGKGIPQGLKPLVFVMAIEGQG
jgi:hypothetical protein